MPLPFDTLIFDLDGTISDPFVGISRSVNFALESLDYEAVDPEAIRPLIGPPLTEIFEHLLGSLPEARMLELIDRYRERYSAVGYAENQLYEEVPRSIAHLAASGCTMGVCTSKRTDYAVRIVDMFGLMKYFSFVDGGSGLDKRKQVAAIIDNGLAPGPAVMIGDRAIDILAGKTNNLATAGVLWGFGERKELEDAAPDFILDSPGKLADLLLQ